MREVVIAIVAVLGVSGGVVAGCADRSSPAPRSPLASASPSGTPSGSPGESAAPSTGGSPAGSASAAPATVPLRYVAFGDSYTIGTALPAAADRWPDRLVARLGTAPPTLTLTANLGMNGFTSRDVIEVELPQLDALRPEFASVLIGVNDVVQGVPPDTYRANAARILDELLRRLPADRIVTVATPDYTVTPQGASYGDPATQSAAIRENNAILRDLAATRGISFVDIFDLSLRAAADRTLVADDGLHPSGAQYALWVDRVEPVVAALLGR